MYLKHASTCILYLWPSITIKNGTIFSQHFDAERDKDMLMEEVTRSSAYLLHKGLRVLAEERPHKSASVLPTHCSQPASQAVAEPAFENIQHLPFKIMKTSVNKDRYCTVHCTCRLEIFEAEE